MKAKEEKALSGGFKITETANESHNGRHEVSQVPFRICSRLNRIWALYR